MNEYRGVRQSSQNSSLYITLILGFHRFGPDHDSLGLLVNPIISPSFRSCRSFATFYPIHQSLNHLIFWIFLLSLC